MLFLSSLLLVPLFDVACFQVMQLKNQSNIMKKNMFYCQKEHIFQMFLSMIVNTIKVCALFPFCEQKVWLNIPVYLLFLTHQRQRCAFHLAIPLIALCSFLNFLLCLCVSSCCLGLLHVCLFPQEGGLSKRKSSNQLWSRITNNCMHSCKFHFLLQLPLSFKRRVFSKCHTP